MNYPMTRPPLSVVISTLRDPSTVLKNLGDLPTQIRDISGELIVVTGAPADGTLPPEGIRVHRIPGGSVFDCRLAAFDVASADILALTEDHCIHSDRWCARILKNFSSRPNLVLLGGAVSNGSSECLEDLMNYWMTFATYAPGQVTATHPCVAQIIVKVSAIEAPQRPGELENSVIEKWKQIPGAIYIDPELTVSHVQSHGFWNTFAIHYHNGRVTGGFSNRRINDQDLSLWKSLRWSWMDSQAHLRRAYQAFRSGKKSSWSIVCYLLLILPLVAVHATGELVGYHKGPGKSALRLV